MKRMVRLFVAVELPDEVRRGCEDIMRRLKESGAKVRWVAPQKLHLTLKFIGDFLSSEIGTLSDLLAESVGGIPAFELACDGVELFPTASRPTVVAVRIEDNGGMLPVVKAIEDACEAAGVAREKRSFRSHLTLGRLKRKGRRTELGSLPQLIDSLETELQEHWLVDELVLVMSELSPRGPAYTTLARFPVGSSGAEH